MDKQKKHVQSKLGKQASAMYILTNIFICKYLVVINNYLVYLYVNERVLQQFDFPNWNQ